MTEEVCLLGKGRIEVMSRDYTIFFASAYDLSDSWTKDWYRLDNLSQSIPNIMQC